MSTQTGPAPVPSEVTPTVSSAPERWAVGQQVVARYPFAGTSPEDLPFQRKDVLTIVRQTKDPMWYRARNPSGLEGMIPANYVRLKDDVTKDAPTNSLPRVTAKPDAPLCTPGAPVAANGVASVTSKEAASPISSLPSVSDSLHSTSSETAPALPSATIVKDSNSSMNDHLLTKQQPSVVESNPTTVTNNVIISSVTTNNDNNNSGPDPLAASSPTANHVNQPDPASTANDTNMSGEKREVRMESMAWFHGKISRDQAEALLLGGGDPSLTHPDGTYLIRESTYFPGDYTLCLLFESKVEHYHILYKENRLTIDEEVFFENLSQLVRHYENDADGLVTNLLNFVSKTGALDFDVKVSEFYDAGWVIPKEDVILASKLGKGEFGDVWEGKYKNSLVAIKCLKDDARAQKILKEASIMTSLRHPNLVELLGVVFSPQDGIVWLITEFMGKGSLVDFLRSRGRPMISKKNQISFASDSCDAMTYLEERHIVHRDLAARNVLLSDDPSSETNSAILPPAVAPLVAKVSDFGLARPDDYSIEGGKFPIKWTAPEALRYSKFSNKSDMWSFGVLLWEIYSFGRTPYPRIPIVDVVKHVERGYRMEAPEGCPDGIYDIMRAAWSIDPEQRPSFASVLSSLREIQTSTPN